MPRTCRWRQEQRTPSALHLWSSKRDSQRKPGGEEVDEKEITGETGEGNTLKPGASSCATGDTPDSVTRAGWASDMMMGFVELVGFFEVDEREPVSWCQT